jgi:hypothetical protein
LPEAIMNGQNSTRAGWYPDPSDSQRMRYWDGNNWSGGNTTVPLLEVNSIKVISS